MQQTHIPNIGKTGAAKLPKIFTGWNKQYSEDLPVKSKTGLVLPIKKNPRDMVKPC